MYSLSPSSASPLQLPLTNRLLRSAESVQGAGAEAAGATEASPSSFAGLLGQGVSQVNAMQQDATLQINDLLTGGDVNQAEVFTAVQKADMAFRMLVQVRNKLMAAYEEINNIRI